MVAKRAEATAKVNEYFNFIAGKEIHRDAIHAWKRGVAAAVIAGGEAPVEFAAEALMRKTTPLELAHEIAGKPNAAAVRELERQQRLLEIEAAVTPDQLPG